MMNPPYFPKIVAAIFIAWIVWDLFKPNRK